MIRAAAELLSLAAFIAMVLVFASAVPQ